MNPPVSVDPTLAGLRQEYSRASLRRNSVDSDPIRQFRRWFDEACRAGVLEPNAMILSTVSADGRPSSRTVLLKDLDSSGFVFFTSYSSRKGTELGGNPHAALTFLWKELERQVNICGRVAKVSRELSEAYFRTRPYDSQIGAHVSQQSRVIPGREWLEERFAGLRARYPEGSVPLPDDWGGYRLVPDSVEFWQGRPGRLHDRIRYAAQPDGSWTIERLSP